MFFPVDRTSNLCRSTMPNSCCHTSCALFNVLSVIATRLKPLLNVIIVTEQTGGTQDRDVADNLSHFKNVIGYHATATGKRKSKGKGKAAIVSLDFEKAFDRLDRTFLYELMMKLGFSKTFLDMIRTLYEGNISKVVTNGKATADVQLGRGVRQGCPLAMYLYIIFINPLLERLKSCMVGTEVSGKTIKLAAYVDDIAIMTGEELDLEQVESRLDEFMGATNSIFNKEKTNTLAIGSCTEKRNWPVNWLGLTNKVKLLGITWFSTIKKTITENYTELKKFSVGLMAMSSNKKLEHSPKSNALQFVCGSEIQLH